MQEQKTVYSNYITSENRPNKILETKLLDTNQSSIPRQAEYHSRPKNQENRNSLSIPTFQPYPQASQQLEKSPIKSDNDPVISEPRITENEGMPLSSNRITNSQLAPSIRKSPIQISPQVSPKNNTEEKHELQFNINSTDLSDSLLKGVDLGYHLQMNKPSFSRTQYEDIIDSYKKNAQEEEIKPEESKPNKPLGTIQENNSSQKKPKSQLSSRNKLSIDINSPNSNLNKLPSKILNQNQTPQQEQNSQVNNSHDIYNTNASQQNTTQIQEKLPNFQFDNNSSHNFHKKKNLPEDPLELQFNTNQITSQMSLKQAEEQPIQEEQGGHQRPKILMKSANNNNKYINPIPISNQRNESPHKIQAKKILNFVNSPTLKDGPQNIIEQLPQKKQILQKQHQKQPNPQQQNSQFQPQQANQPQQSFKIEQPNEIRQSIPQFTDKNQTQPSKQEIHDPRMSSENPLYKISNYQISHPSDKPTSSHNNIEQHTQSDLQQQEQYQQQQQIQPQQLKQVKPDSNQNLNFQTIQSGTKITQQNTHQDTLPQTFGGDQPDQAAKEDMEKVANIIQNSQMRNLQQQQQQQQQQQPLLQSEDPSVNNVQPPCKKIKKFTTRKSKIVEIIQQLDDYFSLYKDLKQNLDEINWNLEKCQKDPNQQINLLSFQQIKNSVSSKITDNSNQICQILDILGQMGIQIEEKYQNQNWKHNSLQFSEFISQIKQQNSH